MTSDLRQNYRGFPLNITNLYPKYDKEQKTKIVQQKPEKNKPSSYTLIEGYF